MRVLIDTDILIDVALKRAEFYRDSNRVLAWVETGGGQAAIAWHPFRTKQARRLN